MAVQNLKEVVILACKSAELIEAIADGVGIGDLPELIAVGRAAGPAIRDVKLALTEYVTASDAEVAGLEAELMSSLDLSDDKIEAVIEQSFNVIMQLRVLAALLVKPVPVAA